MSKCNWVLVGNADPESEVCRIANTLKKSGYDYTFLTMKEAWTKTFPTSPNSIIYSPCSIAYKASSSADYISWWNPMSMQCTRYYAYWGKYLFNRDYVIYPIGEVCRMQKQIFDVFAEPSEEGIERIYMRPNANNKIFGGGLFSKLELSATARALNDPGVLVVISSPKKIKAEIRYIIHRGKIVTQSLYLPHKSPSGFPGGHALAQELANNPYDTLPPIYVVDIGLGENNEIGLLEIGAVNTSSWYEADYSKVVAACNREAEEFLT